MIRLGCFKLYWYEEMKTKIQQVIEEIKALSANERAIIAQVLINSLEEPQDEDVEQAWILETERRLAQFESGEIKAVSWEDIKQNLKKQ